MTNRSKALACVIIAVAVAGGAAAALRRSLRSPPVLTDGTLLAPARALADFSLTDNRGRNKYVPNFSPEFTGVTAANLADIEALAKRCGIAVSVQRAANGNYAIDHSEATLVVNPDERIVGARA